jgi:hypothetical protein
MTRSLRHLTSYTSWKSNALTKVEQGRGPVEDVIKAELRQAAMQTAPIEEMVQ